jgi:serine phosphatase RsbU (regulator of sigma subunit)
MNRNKEMFGFERLQDIVKRLTVDSSQLVKESFLKEVDRFSGATKQHDDMTVVVVQVKR